MAVKSTLIMLSSRFALESTTWYRPSNDGLIAISLNLLGLKYAKILIMAAVMRSHFANVFSCLAIAGVLSESASVKQARA